MRLNAIQLFTNSSLMMSILFIPILADDLGASGTEIGMIGAVYGASLFISTYIFSRASDVISPKKLLYAGFFSTAVTFFLQIFANDPFSLGVIRTLAGFSAGIYPATLILYVFNLKRNLEKFLSFMPLGWALGFLSAGIIAVYREIFALSSLLFAASFLITLTIPDMELLKKKKADYFSLDVLKKNRNIYLAFFLRQMGANNVWIIFPLYLKSLGANEFWIGIIYMLNPTLQFFIMRNLGKFSNRSLIHAGFLISSAAFLTFLPLKVYYEAVLGLILIAFSFSCLFVGSLHDLLEKNEDKGTSAGLLNSIISLSTVTGSLMGGTILEHYNFQVVMVTAAFFAIIGYAIFRFEAGSCGRYQKSS